MLPRRAFFAVAVATGLIVGWVAQSPHSTPQHAAALVPSTNTATSPQGARESIRMLLSGSVHALAGYETSAVSYLPAYGLLVQG